MPTYQLVRDWEKHAEQPSLCTVVRMIYQEFLILRLHIMMRKNSSIAQVTRLMIQIGVLIQKHLSFLTIHIGRECFQEIQIYKTRYSFISADFGNDSRKTM